MIGGFPVLGRNSDIAYLHGFSILITIRITVKDYAPAESDSLGHKLEVLLMFKSMMVHV